MTDVDGAHNLSIFSSLVWSQQKGCPQKGSKGDRLRPGIQLMLEKAVAYLNLT
jgi:hypothetical protein